jgi:hypothetical protein
MNTQQTFEHLKELKLYGMAGCYDTQLHQPAEKQPDAHTLIAMMTEAEAVSRITQRTNLYLRLARFWYNVLPAYSGQKWFFVNFGGCVDIT